MRSRKNLHYRNRPNGHLCAICSFVRLRTVCAWPTKMPVYQAVRQVGNRSARPSPVCSHDNTWLCTQKQPDLWWSGPTLLPTVQGGPLVQCSVVVVFSVLHVVQQ